MFSYKIFNNNFFYLELKLRRDPILTYKGLRIKLKDIIGITYSIVNYYL